MSLFVMAHCHKRHKFKVRRILVLAFYLCMCMLCYAQEIKVQDTFLGCSYGESKTEVFQHLKSMGLEVKDKYEDILGIKYPNIGGIGFDFANMFFYKGYFYKILFVIDGKNEKVCESIIHNIKNRLEEKYQIKYPIENSFFYQDGTNDVSLYQLSNQVVLSYTNMKIRDFKESQEL